MNKKMVKKIYKKLTDEQRARNIIFSSCLSEYITEMQNDTVHEIHKDDDDISETKRRLLDDGFFNQSHFKFNIIRQ